MNTVVKEKEEGHEKTTQLKRSDFVDKEYHRWQYWLTLT